MVSVEAMRAAKLAAAEAAVLALLREAVESGLDGLTITAEDDNGQPSIDLSYTRGGIPVSGESL